MNIGSVTVQCRPYGRSAGFLVVILVVGAMIGKLIADYGSTTDYICIHELVRKEVLV
jgi:H+/gluconate symporter-like permease